MGTAVPEAGMAVASVTGLEAGVRGLVRMGVGDVNGAGREPESTESEQSSRHDRHGQATKHGKPPSIWKMCVRGTFQQKDEFRERTCAPTRSRMQRMRPRAGRYD
jgi:hypothetical protein